MRFLPELPLLRRELTELANRRRTYIVRMVGAIVILFFVFIAYDDVMDSRAGRVSILNGGGISAYFGVGGEIFSLIVPLLFAVISLLLPALCCASITAEKESNTIGTLLLTRLSPATIVVEKFGSRLVPMLTLLLLTFPVLAHVYLLGGVGTYKLISTLWLLLCQCFLVASLAIFFSAWFATTVSAFVWSYVVIALLAALTYSLGVSTFVPSAVWSAEFVADQRFGYLQYQQLPGSGIGSTVPGAMLLLVVLKGLPSLIVTALLLLAARLVLVRRAFVTQKSILLNVFRSIDRFFRALNERTTGGIELIKDTETLPVFDPVAWRERTKKAFGKVHYLIRVLLVIESPTLYVCMLAAESSARSAFAGLYILQAVIWTLCALITAVKAATLMSSERARETIEPLLATPMHSSEIINQKIAGMRRLIIVLLVPILTINLTNFLLFVNFQSLSTFLSSAVRPLTYLVLSTGTTLLILVQITWVSAGLGMRIHSQTKAVIAAVTCLAGWVAVPFIIVRLLQMRGPASEFIVSISPLGAVAWTELYLIEPFLYGQLSTYSRIGAPDVSAIILVAISISLHLVLLLSVWVAVRRLAPRFLNRLDGDTGATRLPDAAASREPGQVTVAEGTLS